MKKVEESGKWTIFGKNGKPIALLFRQNMPFLGTFQFALENEESGKWTIFGKNGKPIALLFRQNMLFLGTFWVLM